FTISTPVVSSLFPYTTLFRSRCPLARFPLGAPVSTSTARSLWRHADFLKLWSAQSISVFGSQVSALAIPFVAALVLHVEAFRFADRKSTRLNSSHEWISYAVF